MAASSNILQQLAKKSPQYKLALLVLALLLAGGGYYQFRYSGLQVDEDNVNQSKDSLLAQQRRFDKELVEQEKLRDRYEELKRSIRDNQKALPTEAELPALYDHLQRKAADTGVTIQKWDRMDEQPVDIYIRVPVNIEVSGSFYEIMHYFSLLGPQRQDALQAAGKDGKKKAGPRIDERIVSIDNLELGKAKLQDGEVILEAKFVASTFRQKEDPAKKAAAKKAAEKKAAAKKAGKSNAKSGVRRMTGAGVKSSINATSSGAERKRKDVQDKASSPPGRTPSAPSGGGSSGGGSFGIRRRRRRGRRVRLGPDHDDDALDPRAPGPTMISGRSAA